MRSWRTEIYSALRRVRRVIKWSTLIAVVSSLSLTGDGAEFGGHLDVFRSPSYIKQRDKHSNKIMLLLLNVKLRIFRKYLKKNSWHSVITAVSIESLAVRKNDRKVNKYNDGIVLVEINQASSCGIFGKKFHHRNCKLNCMKFLSQFSVLIYHTEFVLKTIFSIRSAYDIYLSKFQ